MGSRYGLRLYPTDRQSPDPTRSCTDRWFGGEIAAAVADTCFEWLDAPVRRCRALDTPIPFHPNLEADYLPFGRLDEEIEALLQY